MIALDEKNGIDLSTLSCRKVSRLPALAWPCQLASSNGGNTLIRAQTSTTAGTPVDSRAYGSENCFAAPLTNRDVYTHTPAPALIFPSLFSQQHRKRKRRSTATRERRAVSTCGVDNTHRDTFLAPTCIRSPVPAAGEGVYSRSEASKLVLLGYTPKAFAWGINTHTHTRTPACCCCPRELNLKSPRRSCVQGTRTSAPLGGARTARPLRSRSSPGRVPSWEAARAESRVVSSDSADDLSMFL
jgi:hypothetical protein